MITNKPVSKNELPEGWAWANLGDLVDDSKQDLVDGPFGSNLKSCEYQSEGVPVLKIQNIKNNRFVDKNIDFISKEKADSLIRHSFKSEDLIITKLGNPLGACCKVPNKYTFGIIVADLMRLRPSKQKVIADYLLHAINSEITQKQFKSITKGTTRPRVNLTIVREIKIPLPPLPEQPRIVAKIEELFSELDKGVEALKTAQQQLKVYRQAVLKWAFEGKLTEEWRKQQKHLPTASQLLEQIKDEWEKLTKANGKRLKPIARITETELAGLPILPSGWAWVRLGEITYSVKDGPHYSPPYQDKGIPFISGGNIRPEGVDFTNIKYISSELNRELNKRCKPEVGDILYTKGGTTGIARVNTYNFEFNVWVHVAVLKILNSTVPYYIQNALNSHHCYKQSQQYTHGVGNQDLGLTRMVNITLPICSIEEQIQIVHEIETRLSVADKLEEAISQSLQQAEALRQSILKKAFEGELVPQDPNDEPASKLLERIEAEKATQKPEKKTRKKKANP